MATATATRIPRRVIFIVLPTRTMVEAAVTCADVSAMPPNMPPATGTTGGGVTG